MRTLARTVHMIGLAAFVGTVLSHVLVSVVADPSDPVRYHALMVLKDTGTQFVLIPGLVLMGLSGIVMVRRMPRPWPAWLTVKLGLVAAAAANGLLVLLPAGARIAEAASAGAQAPDALAREAIAGPVNVALILAIVVLSIARPSRRRTEALS
ncbi:hypothetical protein C882_2630 [Caenispirillum salinarum AK4]|uniref:DUF2269 family protein n=1 Tax=Caenispirillum salinarum AK4 TaxID=1238182 RepID=K9HWG2_9PROT|nr:hypothetical protein [Caenispirillum salinarum]EKV32551.1 hypothetical protein C882_2630 [Caenispirillum salinarum AK4]